MNCVFRIQAGGFPRYHPVSDMNKTLKDIGEFRLIDALAELDVVSGIGDDCAVWTPPPGHDIVMTTDALIERVHFNFDWYAFEDIGWKSAAVNLSDLAAMGAEPVALLYSLAFPKRTLVDGVIAIYRGVEECLDSLNLDIRITGGNVAESPEGMMISVTAVGCVPTGGAALRSGAKPGDDIWVTGTLGDSALGLFLLMNRFKEEDWPGWQALVDRHRRPTPSVAFGMAARNIVSAMIDVSDGLSGDIGHLCIESGVGAFIDESLLPVSEEARNVAERILRPVEQWALNGGEDYELLMTAHPDRANDLRRAAESTGTRLTRIGSITTGEMQIRKLDGAIEELESRAFTHF